MDVQLLAEPQLLICHTCERRAESERTGKDRKKRPPKYRVVARDVAAHASFMDQHRDCAANGWGTSPALR